MAEDKTPKKIDNTLAKTIESRVKRTVPRPDNSAVLLQRQLKADGRKLENVSSVSKSVESNFNILSRKFDLISDQFVKVEQRITDYDKIVNEKFSVAGSIIQAQNLRMGQELSRSFKQIDSTLKSVDTRLGRQNQRIDTLKRELDFLKLRTKENDLRYTRMMTPKLPQQQKEKSGMTLKQAAVGTILGAALTGALIWAYNNRETIMDIYEKLKKAAAVAGDALAALGPSGAAKAATTTAKVGVSATKTVTRTVSRGKTAIINAIRKALGKQGIAIGAKKVPVFGMLVGAGMAAYRAAIGDKEGAMLELGSGATSMIPGVGTVGSLAIDIGIIARDAYFEMYQVYPREDPLAKERWQELYDTVIEYMSGSSKEENEKQAREKTSGAAHKALQQNQGRGISKNAVTVASTEKGETKNVEIKTAGDIFIDSLRKIKMEAKDEIRLKANKIILDAPKIEILTPRSGVTYGAQQSGSSTPSSKLEYPTNPKDPGAAKAKEILSGKIPQFFNSGFNQAADSYDGGSTPSGDGEMLPPIQVDNGPRATVSTPRISHQSMLPGTSTHGSNSGYLSGHPGSGSGVPAKVTDPVGVSSQSQPETTKQTSRSQSESISSAVFGDITKTSGGIDRSRFIRELETNPKLLRDTMVLVEAEAGGQGPAAQKAVFETMLNRAAISKHKSLSKIVYDTRYYQPYKDGGINRARRRMNDNRVEHYMSSIFPDVLGGLDSTRGGTHNASANVARSVKRGGYNSVRTSVIDIGAETFYSKTWEQKGIKGLPRHEIDQNEKSRENFERIHGPPMSLLSPNDKPDIKKYADDPIGLLPNKRRTESTRTDDRFRINGKTPFNYGQSQAARAEFGPLGKNLTTITLSNGMRVTVNKTVANDAKGFLDELLARGYNIKDIGGYNFRNIRGSNRLSSHAGGGTIDINASENPFKSNKTDMPDGVKLLAMKYGFAQLGNDKMHFERVPPHYRTVYLQRLLEHGTISKDDPFIKQKIAEGVISQELVDNTKIVQDTSHQKQTPTTVDKEDVAPIQDRGLTSFVGLTGNNNDENDIHSRPQLVDKPKPNPIYGTQSTPAQAPNLDAGKGSTASGQHAQPDAAPTPNWDAGKPAPPEETAIASADDDMSSRGIQMPRNPYAGDNMMPGPGDHGTGEYGEQCLV